MSLISKCIRLYKVAQRSCDVRFGLGNVCSRIRHRIPCNYIRIVAYFYADLFNRFCLIVLLSDINDTESTRKAQSTKYNTF